jgi:hypothetical protein
MLPQLPHHGIHARWDFLHFDYSRTIVWRPSSNFCDPNWLAGEILGKLTDTLELDFWQKDRGPEADEVWLQDGRRFQYDFVVETDLRLGSGESAHLAFEGRVFRWVNGTAERKPIVSMSVDSLQVSQGEHARLNRLLSAIVWHQAVPLKGGVWRGREPKPLSKNLCGSHNGRPAN